MLCLSNVCDLAKHNVKYKRFDRADLWNIHKRFHSETKQMSVTDRPTVYMQNIFVKLNTTDSGHVSIHKSCKSIKST